MSILPSLQGYIFSEKLGKGSFATVYKAYHNVVPREVVAIKCVLKASLTKSSVENIITEISMLKKLKHENIVEFKDFQWDNTYIYIIMEYCRGGDLSHFIKTKRRLPEAVAQRFLQQLAKALHYLRSQNIAHMDLKPQNILLSSGSHPVLKLGDFGLSQYLQSDSSASSLRGSPLYMAPEILLKHHYDARVDLWSIGIILFECLFGQAPFSSQTFAELAEKIKSSDPIKLPVGAQVSDKCRELILGLLQRDPNKRMTFEEFFNHPFVDMEHMPSQESYAKGVSLVQEAVQADSKGDYCSAIQAYSQALDYLVPHLHYEKNPIKRREMRKKFLEYVSRAEELKKILKNRDLKRSESVPSSPSAPTYSEMLASKPDLKKAIFLAKQADLLVNDGCYDDASDIYKTALEIMVSTLKAEQGPYKELMCKEVDKWMQKAEDLKTYQSILRQQKKIQKMQSGDAQKTSAPENLDTTCVIQ